MKNWDERLPYPGLRSFDREEADLFFGRDGIVDAMVDRLAETRFLAVLGASGSGKSSLVKTGLLDGLDLGLHPAGPDWAVCAFTPGGQPFKSLSTALFNLQQEAVGQSDNEGPNANGLSILEGFLRQGPRSIVDWVGDGYLRAGAQLLLFVDQFEELFRYSNYAEREDAEAFVKLLIESKSAPDVPVHVVVTMRSDFLGACALVPGLAETMNSGAFLTPRMSRENCREAIVGPARMMGVDIEPGLVNRLLNDLVTFAPWDGDDDQDQLKRISRRADQLPVMQHLLNRLWRAATADTKDERVQLTQAAYDSLGGLSGALDSHGAEIIGRFDDDEQNVVEQIFRALVDGNSPISATRRPQRVEDLIAATGGDEAKVHEITNAFRGDDCNFLRPGPDRDLSPETVIDISHESLIRQWSRLSDWVTEEAREASFWQRLSTAMVRHQNGEGDLLSGLDLANLSAWWREKKPTANWASRYSDNYDAVAAYLEESELRERERTAQKNELERRNKRRLQAGLAGTSIAAIAATFLGVLAMNAERRAEQISNAAFDGAQALNTGLFEKMDTGLSVPAETRHALFQDRDGVIDVLAETLSSKDRELEMKTELLLRTSNSLLDAGWLHEATPRTERLEKLVFAEDDNKDWAPPKVQIDSLIVLARKELQNARYSQALEILNRASGHLEQLEPSWDKTVAQSEIAFFRFQAFSGRSDLRAQLEQVDVLNRLHLDILETWANDDDESHSVADTADPETLSKRNRYQAALVLERYIRAQLRALTHSEFHLSSGVDQGSGTDELMQSLDTAFERWEELTASNMAAQQLLPTIYLTKKSQIYSDKYDDHELAFDFSHQAVDAAETLCATDPGNRRYLLWLVNALLNRANIAHSKEEQSQADSDLSAAHSIAVHVKYLAPTSPEWRAAERRISYFTYDANQKDDLSEARRAAARQNTNFLFDQSRSKLHETHDELETVLWSLLDPDFDSPALPDAVTTHLQRYLKGLQERKELNTGDVSWMRDASIVLNRVTQNDPLLLGEQLWTEVYLELVDLGQTEDEKLRDRQVGLSIFNNLNLHHVRHIGADRALALRKGMSSLEKLLETNSVSEVIASAQQTLDRVPLPNTSNDARMALLVARQSVFDQVAKKYPSSKDHQAWLELLDKGIAEAQELEASDFAYTQRRAEYYVGARAASLGRLNRWTEARQEYEKALNAALDLIRLKPNNQTFLNNGLVYARQILAANEQLDEAADLSPPLVQMFEVVLRDENKTKLLAKSGSYLSSLNRRVDDIVSSQKDTNDKYKERVKEFQGILARVEESIATHENERMLSAPAENLEALSPPEFRSLHNTQQLDEGERVNWGYNPVYSGAWRTLEGAERDAMLSRVITNDDTRRAVFLVRSVALPFYSSGELVEYEFRMPDGEFALGAVLVFPDQLYQLSGTSPAIHEANARAPLTIRNFDDASAYLRFFTTYVNGQEGAFQIVDSVDEISWRPSAEPEAVKEVQRNIRPLSLWRKSEDPEKFYASATVQYSNALFSALFAIAPTGMIEMLDDEPLLADLPVEPVSIASRSGRASRAVIPRVDLSKLGISSVGGITSELELFADALEKSEVSHIEDISDEYFFLLGNDNFVDTLSNQEIKLNSFAYDLLERNVAPQQAAKIAERAHQLAPEDPHIMDTYGWALIKTGKVDDGVEILEKAEPLFGKQDASALTLSDLYTHLGQGYRLLGRTEKARSSLNRAKSLRPSARTKELISTELEALEQAAPDQVGQ